MASLAVVLCLYILLKRFLQLLLRQGQVASAPQFCSVWFVARVPEDLQAVAVGIVKVDCPADQMVDWGYFDACLRQCLVCPGQGRFVGDLKGDVVQAGSQGMRLGCARADALQRDLVMDAASRQEGVVVLDPLYDFQVEETRVEIYGTVQVPHFEMRVADNSCVGCVGFFLSSLLLIHSSAHLSYLYSICYCMYVTG